MTEIKAHCIVLRAMLQGSCLHLEQRKSRTGLVLFTFPYSYLALDVWKGCTCAFMIASIFFSKLHSEVSRFPVQLLHPYLSFFLIILHLLFYFITKT